MARRTDWPALTRSLSGQIAHAFLDQNPQFRKLLGIEQGLVGSVGAGAAEALLREMLTPEAVAALLDKGQARVPGAGLAGWRMPSLGDAFRGGPWRALTNSRFEGPLSFVVGLDGPEGRYDVHLHLDGTTWRLSGLDVPEAISAGGLPARSPRGSGRANAAAGDGAAYPSNRLLFGNPFGGRRPASARLPIHSFSSGIATVKVRPAESRQVEAVGDGEHLASETSPSL